MACFPAILSGGPFSFALSFASVVISNVGIQGIKGEGGGYGDRGRFDIGNHALCGGYGGSDSYGIRGNGDGYFASDRYDSRGNGDGYDDS